MTDARLRECLSILGLSARWLARATGWGKSSADRWGSARVACVVPPDVAAWLERRVAAVLADPPPRRASH